MKPQELHKAFSQLLGERPHRWRHLTAQLGADQGLQRIAHVGAASHERSGP